MRHTSSRLMLLGAMLIFGTVGIFVYYIPLPSAAIAFARAVLGLLFLLAVMAFSQRKLQWCRLKRQLPLLLLSGAALGVNWVFLFEAYRHTSVASATACYYLAPMFLVLSAPFLKEKLTGWRIGCVAIAFLGMVFVSGVLTGDAPQLQGILLALGAAVLYAGVMVMNRKLTQTDSFDRTLVQLLVAAVAVLPYMLLRWQPDTLCQMTPVGWILLGIVGISHTGVAYWLYFASVGKLPSQTVAVLSYLDPVVAILLGALLLRQKIDVFGIIGSVLILGSALFCELRKSK